jgi:hypothetical protein
MVVLQIGGGGDFDVHDDERYTNIHVLVGLQPVIQLFTWHDTVYTLNCMASLIGRIII